MSKKGNSLSWDKIQDSDFLKILTVLSSNKSMVQKDAEMIAIFTGKSVEEIMEMPAHAAMSLSLDVRDLFIDGIPSRFQHLYDAINAPAERFTMPDQLRNKQSFQEYYIN